MTIGRPRIRIPSPALIVACLALFVALGGGSYAATTLGGGGIHWTNAKLKNGWTNVPDFAPAGYAKGSSGVVHLRGEIGKAKVSPPRSFLPKGLRPTHQLYLPV